MYDAAKSSEIKLCSIMTRSSSICEIQKKTDKRQAYNNTAIGLFLFNDILK